MSPRHLRVVCCLLAELLAVLAVAPVVHGQQAGAYFPATGHTLTDEHGFLAFYQARDGARLLGAPVTEVVAVEGGAQQYFERGRLELAPDPVSGLTVVRTGVVAAEYTGALYRTFAPMPPRRAIAGELFFEETRHSLREPFLGFWQVAGGVEFFGRPISEPLWEQTPRGQRNVQYFERARLERDADLAGSPDEIQVADLGLALALLRDLSTAPVPNPGFSTAGAPAPLAPNVALLGEPVAPAPIVPLAPKPVLAPAAQADPAPAASRPAPVAAVGGGKRIVVNLSDQWLYAYENGEIVFDAPVATGRDGMQTPIGSYGVYAKLPLQTMRGVLDGVPWVVPNVPNVMYINGDVALHGTYWHNLFGSGARPSHGCVNLPLKAAKWLYGWAPVGTPVRVTY